MSTDRRFNEREVREVFERAAAEQERAARRRADDGLSVEEMQEIGASAGIAPEFVAAAARSVALGEPESGRTTLAWVPLGVFRTEFLPAPPTDALWDDLVADLRRTFSARGRVSEGGRVREWRNGNLRVTLEPAGDGSRLHLRTRRDTVRPMVAAFSITALAGLFVVVTALLSGAAWLEALAPGLLPLLIVLLGTTVLWSGQRSWAATRERQMAEVAARAVDAARAAPSVPARAPASEPALASEPTPRLDLDALGTDLPDAADPLADDARQPRRRTR